MIDVHSHIIPKMDDGSTSIQETELMLKTAEQMGFTDVIATSHYIENYYETDSIKRHAMVEAINKVAKKREIAIKIHCGSEIFITPNLVKLVKDKKASTLADSRYVLFELPTNNIVQYLSQVIFEIKANGLIPVIAHPERYCYIQKKPDSLVELIENGVLFQANYASVSGYYGYKAKQTLVKLLKANMIHFLGTDSHEVKKYDRILQDRIKLEKVISKEKLEELTIINPKHILKDIPIK